MSPCRYGSELKDKIKSHQALDKGCGCVEVFACLYMNVFFL